MSSAHVYLRLNKGERLEDVDPSILMDCAQLVKANSIEGRTTHQNMLPTEFDHLPSSGCKMKDVTVIYTRWRNLNKTSSMEVGSIGFHDRYVVQVYLPSNCLLLIPILTMAIAT